MVYDLDERDIVARGDCRAGIQILLLRPVPEPASAALLFCGLALLVLQRRAKGS